MTKHTFCYRVGAQIRCRSVQDALLRELSGHIEDHQEALEASGLAPQEAEAQAVAAMGDPVELGKALDRLYDPRWYRLLRALSWVVSLLAVWLLITGVRCQLDGQLNLPALLLPSGGAEALMETDGAEVLWEGVCRESARLGSYELSIPAAALVRSDYAPDGGRQTTYYLRGVFRADHWQPWLRSLSASVSLTLAGPEEAESFLFGTWNDTESLCSGLYLFQLPVSDPDAEWFSLTLLHGDTALAFPISREEASQ